MKSEAKDPVSFPIEQLLGCVSRMVRESEDRLMIRFKEGDTQFANQNTQLNRIEDRTAVIEKQVIITNGRVTTCEKVTKPVLWIALAFRNYWMILGPIFLTLWYILSEVGRYYVDTYLIPHLHP